MRRLALALALLSGLPLAAAAQEAADGTGAELRVLDKTTGIVTDVSIPRGGTAEAGLLTIALAECRYPPGDPASDGWALLEIRYRDRPEPLFRGWMIASAPALNAMEHPRYDVWVRRCSTS